MSLTFPRETTEFLELIVEVDGQAVTDYQVTVLPYGQRPVTGWGPAATVAGKHGVMITEFAPGYHDVWVKVTDNPEAPVVWCVQLYIT